MQKGSRHPLPEAVGAGVYSESVPARVPNARSATAGASGSGQGEPPVAAELYQIITKRLEQARAEVDKLSAWRDHLERTCGPFDMQTDVDVSPGAANHQGGDGGKLGDDQ